MLNWIAWNRTVFTFYCEYVLEKDKWNHLTVSKNWTRRSFKNPIYKMCLEIIYLIYMHKKDLAYNGYYAIKPNQTVLELDHWPNELNVRQWFVIPEFNPRSSHTKDFKKLVVDAALLYTQHYKVKWDSAGNGVVPPPTPHCSSYLKGSLWVTFV